MKFLALVFFIPLSLCAGNCLAQQAPVSQKPIDTLSCKVNYEILQTTLKLADELFINGMDSLAELKYREAMDRVNFYILILNCGDENYYRLCRNNIEYRLLLLENKMDFWGISYNMSPLNPITHREKFNNLKTIFDKTVNDINDLLGKIGTAEDKVSESDAGIELAKTESSVQEYEQNKQEIKINQYDENINLTRNKIDVMNARQMEIEKEAVSKLDQVKALSSSMTDIVLSAMCQAAGLPVNPARLKLDKSLQDNLISTGLQIAATDPSIRESIKEISAAADKLITIYQSADSLKDKIQSIRQSAKEIHDFIHQPSFDKLIAIGEKLLTQLSPDQVREWKKVAEQTKNVASLLQVAKDLPELKKTVFNRFLKEQAVMKKLFEIFEDEKKEFSKWMLDAGMKAMDMVSDAKAKIAATEMILHSAAESLINDMSNDVLEEWKKLSKTTTVAALIAWMKQVKLEELAARIRIEGTRLVFIASGIKMDMQQAADKLKSLVSDDKLVLYSAGLTASCKEILTSGIPELKKAFLENLDIQWLSEAGNVLFKNMQPDQIQSLGNSMYNEVIADLKSGTSLAARVEEKVDAFNIGSFFTTNAGGRDPASLIMPAVSGQLSKGDAVRQAVITAGIAASCPYVAIAGQFIGSWHNRSQLLDRIEELNKEQKEITINKLYTYDILHELIVNRTIANLDKKISEERQNYSRFLFNMYRTKAASAAKNVSIIRLKVNNRKALLFFLSEKMREQYSLINKSLLQRHGYSFYERIAKDPENFRYAIDEDISLFQWLDNSTQSARADIDQIKVYWEKVNALLTAYCSECDKNFAPLMDVLETDPVSIKKYFPEEWRSFTAAIQSGQTGYDFVLPLLPGRSGIIQDADKQQKIRILDVRLGGYSTDNRFVRLTNAKLSHTGISYLLDGNYYKKEVFQPQVRTGIEPGDIPGNNDLAFWPQPFNITALQSRWQNQGGKPNLPLEGYGLFSIYRLHVNITAETKSLADISIRFAYSYKPGDDQLLPDDRRIIFKNVSSAGIRFDNDDVKGLGARGDDWVQRIRVLLNDKNILLQNEFCRFFDIIQVDKEIKIK